MRKSLHYKSNSNLSTENQNINVQVARRQKESSGVMKIEEDRSPLMLHQFESASVEYMDQSGLQKRILVLNNLAPHQISYLLQLQETA